MKSKLMQINKLPYLLILLCFACGVNQNVLVTGKDFFGRNKIVKNLNRYDVYVHSEDSIYIVEDAEMDEQRVIKGHPVYLDSTEISYDEFELTDDHVPNKELNDIHIFIKEDSSGNGVAPVAAHEELSIEHTDVDKVTLVTRNDDEGTAVFGALAIILVILLLGLLAVIAYIGWLILEVLSSCYIATMVYESHDAENVLVLRKFRDRFLNRFLIGRGVIIWYYATSPALVDMWKNNKTMNRIIKGMLDCFVFVIKPFFKKD
jgi:hypothetical protein